MSWPSLTDSNTFLDKQLLIFYRQYIGLDPFSCLLYGRLAFFISLYFLNCEPCWGFDGLLDASFHLPKIIFMSQSHALSGIFLFLIIINCSLALLKFSFMYAFIFIFLLRLSLR